MTVTYGFYNSLNGDRKYNATQMSKIFEGIITDGIFTSVGTGFAVTAPGGSMNISVGVGRAWFNGTWTYNDAALTLTVQTAEAVLNRIDTVVIETNSDNAVRANTIKIIKGTPGSSPSAPTMVRTSTINQYPLADIYVGATVSAISQANVTNRIGTTACPLCTALVPAFDFSQLEQQYIAQFNAWFSDLQNELDSNQASNLQSQINDLESGWTSVSENWTYLSANSFTIPTDGTTRYKKGMGVRWKQGGSYKYAYVIGVAATVLTISGGNQYSIANSAITDIGYTLDPGTAIGFPEFINYTPTFSRSTTNFTNFPTVSVAKFRIVGSQVNGILEFTMPASAGGSGEVWATTPVPVGTGGTDIGQEIAATGTFCGANSVGAGLNVISFWTFTPAIIPITAGYKYTMNFRFLL